MCVGAPLPSLAQTSPQPTYEEQHRHHHQTPQPQQPVFGVQRRSINGNRYGSSYGGANGNGSQNVGNFITDRASSRVLAPPGGASSLSLGWGSTPTTEPVRRALPRHNNAQVLSPVRHPRRPHQPHGHDRQTEPQPQHQPSPASRFDSNGPEVDNSPPRNRYRNRDINDMGIDKGSRGITSLLQPKNTRHNGASYGAGAENVDPRDRGVPGLDLGRAKHSHGGAMGMSGSRRWAAHEDPCITKAPSSIPGLETHYNRGRGSEGNRRSQMDY